MNLFLYPLSLIYGLAIWMRNKAFDAGSKRSVEFDIPIIVVGNLRVGGTGKTPHIEWLISKLTDQYKIGVLSRGYGRKSKGFRWVLENDTSDISGDEPLQIKQKFKNISVAVCEDRVEAVPLMLAEEELDLILLDDAFQHRYITPSYSIIMSSFDKPFFNDSLLPLGRLREPASSLCRANAIVYSKCENISENDKLIYSEKASSINEDIKVFFSSYKYSSLQSFNSGIPVNPKVKEVIAITGLADSSGFIKQVQFSFNLIKHFSYADHHQFTVSEIEEWKNYISSKDISIITTEKDAMRLLSYKDLLTDVSIYYWKIEVEIQAQEILNDIKNIVKLSVQ
jgi:tetraacyldisaccharide 4'-kinase